MCNVVYLNSFCSDVAKQVQVHVFVARFVVPLASPRASFPLKIARVIDRAVVSRKILMLLFFRVPKSLTFKMRLSAKPFL